MITADRARDFPGSPRRPPSLT